MGLTGIKTTDYVDISTGDGLVGRLPENVWRQFNPKVLELGDLATRRAATDVICAVCDLEGFTDFCTNVDPQLEVPEFLELFLQWLFEKVAYRSAAYVRDGFAEMLAPLPFFSKFMGDGVLFLWQTYGVPDKAICSVVTMMWDICSVYRTEFVLDARQKVNSPPKKLRCGIARGLVTAVGEGKDFVGPCIDIASRLQKLSSLSFAFSRRGVNAQKYMRQSVRREFVLKATAIRGIGDHELVFVPVAELGAMTPDEAAAFVDP